MVKFVKLLYSIYMGEVYLLLRANLPKLDEVPAQI